MESSKKALNIFKTTSQDMIHVYIVFEICKGAILHVIVGTSITRYVQCLRAF
jgi:hypothetical protein